MLFRQSGAGQDGRSDDPRPLAALPSSDSALSLTTLRGLRSAPNLEPAQRQRLRQELLAAMGRCQWFTVGIMAPDHERAVACLRACEHAFGWLPLREESESEAAATTGQPPAGGPVFLKGNQHTGVFRVRLEAGLGEGLLITGHNPEQPDCEDTWGPLPLDLPA